EWKDTSLLNGGEVPEKMIFSCKGNKLRLELNGSLVEEISDIDQKSGNALFFAYSNETASVSNPIKISFDDFVATMP
ncbi:MAG: hypothetical protein WCG34_12170, partial [Leptolinea sp.]